MLPVQQNEKNKIFRQIIFMSVFYLIAALAGAKV